jgi:hypothetical protein
MTEWWEKNMGMIVDEKIKKDDFMVRLIIYIRKFSLNPVCI